MNSYINKSFVAQPIWAQANDPSEQKKKQAIKILKLFIKSTKLIVYSFLFLMGLWGCVQSFATPELRTSTDLGTNFEFGFPFGTTGDFRYDLSAGIGKEYYTFTPNNWGFQYGPFFALFVWPGAILALEIMFSLKDAWGGLNALLAITILLLIIRSITLLISIRSTLQAEKISEVQGRIAEINAKYKDVKKDPYIRQKKQMEVQEVYKKNNVKPFAPFEQIFVTIPIFLIIFRTVTALRPIKTIVLFEVWNLSVTPLSEITSNFQNGGWVFIFFLLIAVPTQIFSQKISQLLAKKRNRSSKTYSQKGSQQAKKMRITQNIFMAVFAFFIVISSSAVGLYWFLSALFTIAQSLVIHKIITSRKSKGNQLVERLKQLGINT